MYCIPNVQFRREHDNRMLEFLRLTGKTKEWVDSLKRQHGRLVREINREVVTELFGQWVSVAINDLL